VARASRSGGSGSPIPPSGGQRTGARRFVRESWGELRKVQWPTRAQVGQGTLVVLVVTAIIAAYIYLVDQVSVRIVDQVYGFLLD
jgi:preprotein translocase subunit SecE